MLLEKSEIDRYDASSEYGYRVRDSKGNVKASYGGYCGEMGIHDAFRNAKIYAHTPKSNANVRRSLKNEPYEIWVYYLGLPDSAIPLDDILPRLVYKHIPGK